MYVAVIWRTYCSTIILVLIHHFLMGKNTYVLGRILTLQHLLVWRGEGGGGIPVNLFVCMYGIIYLDAQKCTVAQWIGSLWILLAWNWFWNNWYWFLSKSLIFCFLINTEKSIVSSNMLFRETSMGCHHDLSYLPVSVFISHLLAPCTLNIWCPKQSMRWSMIV